MTIKRRIKVSNTLMIILPMLLTLLLGGTLYLIIIGVTGVDAHPLGNKITYENRGTAQESIDTGTYTQVTDDVAVYKSASDQYIIVVPDDTEIPFRFEGVQRYYIPLLFVVFLLTVVYFTNRALTRYVIRGVITPIEILVDGVHEIRDGNLEYRIEYDRKDEFVAVCTDFNEMAQRLSDMVDQQQREESNRRELIAGISHDLRTPLTSIKAYLEGLEKGVASSPQMQKKYLDTIKCKAGDLEYIVNQLFLFSKLDIGDFPFHLEDIDIGQELRHFTERHEKEYSEKGLAVSLVENVENVYAEIDVVQFRNVVINILENSDKYKNNEQANVIITCHRDGDTVIIELMDNGPGVSDVTRLFDIFYRSDAARNDPSKGSGLGLAISKKIIERLGGKIGAKHAPGGGLTIEITLPISRHEA